MEDIVAIRVRLATGSDRFFLTYGRLFDAVDPSRTLEVVVRHLHAYDLGGRPVRVEMCHTLQDAKSQPYFFEALFQLSQQSIPLGAQYEAWRRKVSAEMERGKHLHYLGRRRRYGSRPGVAVAR